MGISNIANKPLKAAVAVADSAMMIAEGSIKLARDALTSSVGVVTGAVPGGGQIELTARLASLLQEDRAIGRVIRQGGPMDQLMRRGGAIDAATSPGGALERLTEVGGPLDRLFEPGGVVEQSLEPGGLVDRLTARDGFLVRLTAPGGIAEKLLEENGILERLVAEESALDKLLTPGGPVDQLVTLSATLSRLLPAIEQLGVTVEGLQDASKGLINASGAITDVASRLPGARLLSGRGKVKVDPPLVDPGLIVPEKG